jgi:hypothetical protein
MSNLQYIDMQSTRNLAIIGVSTLLGLMLPFWAKGNAAGINTGIILNNERYFMVIYGMVMNTAASFPIIPNRIKIQGNTVNTSLLATCNTHKNGIWKNVHIKKCSWNKYRYHIE